MRVQALSRIDESAMIDNGHEQWRQFETCELLKFKYNHYCVT